MKITHEMVRAASESRAKDEEGEFKSLGDLLNFSGENKTHAVIRAALAAALTEVAEIERLRRTLHAIVEMIDHCPDAPRNSDSLPGAIRYYADGALRGIDTGVR